jgi:outer membrane protein
VRAESLKEALTSAYLTNPGLDAQRASLRASDEDVPRAKAGYRPTITGTADAGVVHSNTKPPSAGDGETHPKGYALTMSQPIFRGFRVFNSVNVAEANVRAAREQLRITEQTTLLDAVTTYMDVVRDQGILRVRENNVRVLSNELRATQERFAVGEVTKTDVAQAQARRAAAVSALDVAKANLRTSLGNYERIVGHPAHNLFDQPPIDRLLPRSIQDAISTGTAQHPTVVQSVYLEQAARHQIDAIRGELLPTVSLDTQYSHRYEPSRQTDQTENTSVTGRLTWQFWNGGEVESRVRQAKHTAVSRLQLIEQNRATVQAGVVQAWSVLQAARSQLISDQQQVESTRTALAGVREEEKVGQRTLLDVLNAEQEALNAEVQLITTKRNLVVASYSVLSSIGRLNAYELDLGSKIYDDTAHYDEVKRKWTGMRIEYSDGRVEDAKPGEGVFRSTYDVPLEGKRTRESIVTTPMPAKGSIAPPPLPKAPSAAPAGAAPGTVAPPAAPGGSSVAPAPGLPGATDPSKPLQITPPARGGRKGTSNDAPGQPGRGAPDQAAMPLTAPAAEPVKGQPLPPLQTSPQQINPSQGAPREIRPGKVGAHPQPGETVSDKPQLRGSLDNSPWSAKVER